MQQKTAYIENFTMRSDLRNQKLYYGKAGG